MHVATVHTKATMSKVAVLPQTLMVILTTKCHLHHILHVSIIMQLNSVSNVLMMHSSMAQ